MKLYVWSSVVVNKYSYWQDAYVVAASEDEARKLVLAEVGDDEHFMLENFTREPAVYDIGVVCIAEEHWG